MWRLQNQGANQADKTANQKDELAIRIAQNTCVSSVLDQIERALGFRTTRTLSRYSGLIKDQV